MNFRTEDVFGRWDVSQARTFYARIAREHDPSFELLEFVVRSRAKNPSRQPTKADFREFLLHFYRPQLEGARSMESCACDEGRRLDRDPLCDRCYALKVLAFRYL